MKQERGSEHEDAKELLDAAAVLFEPIQAGEESLTALHNEKERDRGSHRVGEGDKDSGSGDSACGGEGDDGSENGADARGPDDTEGEADEEAPAEAGAVGGSA